MDQDLLEKCALALAVAKIDALLPIAQDLVRDLEASEFQLHDFINTLASLVHQSYPKCDEAVYHLEKAAASLKTAYKNKTGGNGG